jgi:hypothetical protein
MPNNGARRIICSFYHSVFEADEGRYDELLPLCFGPSGSGQRYPELRRSQRVNSARRVTA